MDRKSGLKRSLNLSTDFKNPILNQDGSELICQNTDSLGKWLLRADCYNREIIDTIRPELDIFSYSWNKHNDKIYFISREYPKSLMEYDTSNKTYQSVFTAMENIYSFSVLEHDSEIDVVAQSTDHVLWWNSSSNKTRITREQCTGRNYSRPILFSDGNESSLYLNKSVKSFPPPHENRGYLNLNVDLVKVEYNDKFDELILD